MTDTTISARNDPKAEDEIVGFGKEFQRPPSFWEKYHGHLVDGRYLLFACIKTLTNQYIKDYGPNLKKWHVVILCASSCWIILGFLGCRKDFFEPGWVYDFKQAAVMCVPFWMYEYGTKYLVLPLSDAATLGLVDILNACFCGTMAMMSLPMSRNRRVLLFISILMVAGALYNEFKTSKNKNGEPTFQNPLLLLWMCLSSVAQYLFQLASSSAVQKYKKHNKNPYRLFFATGILLTVYSLSIASLLGGGFKESPKQTDWSRVLPALALLFCLDIHQTWMGFVYWGKGKKSTMIRQTMTKGARPLAVALGAALLFGETKRLAGWQYWFTLTLLIGAFVLQSSLKE